MVCSADRLAQEGRMLKEPFCILSEPPRRVVFLSNLDKAGRETYPKGFCNFFNALI